MVSMTSGPATRLLTALRSLGLMMMALGFVSGLSAQLPECPLPKVDVLLQLTPPRYVSAVPTAERIADIPEFHDCQRLVVGNTYGSLTAVYAKYKLDSVWVTLVKLDAIARESRRTRDMLLGDTAARATVEVERLTAQFNNVVSGLSGPRPPSGNTNNRDVQVTVLSFLSIQRALLSASVRGWDGPHMQLGIGLGWNCLYLYDTESANPSALMIQHGPQNNTCSQLVPADTSPPSGVTQLSVRRTVAPRSAVTDYPPVARWEWDSQNRHQFIGIACDAWCDVYPKNAAHRPAPVYPVEAAVLAQPMTKHQRTGAIRGWFDEEPLAPSPAVMGQRPTSTGGVLLPHARLEEYTIAATFTSGAWVPVARISLTEDNAAYKASFNFQSDHRLPDPIDARMLTEISLCRGVGCVPNDHMTCPKWPAEETPPGPAERWWARISHRGGSPMYKCVVRRGHEHLNHDNGTPIRIPGTARWRWMREDQTVWVRCDQGCCEVIQ